MRPVLSSHCLLDTSIRFCAATATTLTILSATARGSAVPVLGLATISILPLIRSTIVDFGTLNTSVASRIECVLACSASTAFLMHSESYTLRFPLCLMFLDIITDNKITKCGTYHLSSAAIKRSRENSRGVTCVAGTVM